MEISIAKKAAHDIRTPLAILSMALKHRFKNLPKEDYRLLKDVTNSIQGIAKELLESPNEEILHYDSANKKDHNKNHHILVSQALDEVVKQKRLQYVDKNVEFEYSTDNEIRFASIYGNDITFERMMSNIINNSVEAYDGKQGIVKIDFSADEHVVKIVVEDNGKGMPMETIHKLMLGESISTTKKDGHGIGTQQIRDALAEFHGLQRIQSTIDVGTRITLTIPKSNPKEKTSHDLSYTDVVILDDNQMLAETIKELLQSKGIKNVETYCNPDEFLRNLSRYPVTTRIITDNYFDKGTTLTGNVLAHQLFEKGFTNICALTGLTADIDMYLKYPEGTKIVEKGFDDISESFIFWCKTGC